jgi:hypothetical protein
LIDCTRFAFSTNGDRHSHPDAETIARILVNDPDRVMSHPGIRDLPDGFVGL